MSNHPHSAALATFFERYSALRDQATAILAIRASSPAYREMFLPAALTCVQTDHAGATVLQQAGLTTVTEAHGEFDLCIVEATKHKTETLYHLALGWQRLREGASLVLVAANTLGAESRVKHLAALAPLGAVVSKAKCRVAMLTKQRDQTDLALLQQWLALGALQEIPGTGLLACPGLFSAGQADVGSRLLCAALDPPSAPLRGRGGDFGAGYGLLSHHLLKGRHAIAELHLYDVEWKALHAAQANLINVACSTQLQFHWQDLTQSIAQRNLDWIVMNPPFHRERTAGPTLGLAFIARAADALAPHGVLWLVANRWLPYETTVRERFRETTTVIEQRGFKVLRASGPRALHQNQRGTRA